MTTPKKVKTLEQDAQEFLKSEIDADTIPLRDYFAGAALSGLLTTSGKRLKINHHKLKPPANPWGFFY